MPKWKQTQHRNKVDFVFVLLWNEFTVTDDEHILIEHLIILLSSFENKRINVIFLFIEKCLI